MGWRGGSDLGAHTALTEDQAWGVGIQKVLFHLQGI